MYGKYHITSAQSFYSAADAWTLSPSPGFGLAVPGPATTLTTNAQGQVVSTGQLVRMAPIYQEMRVPGQTQQSFTLLDAFVPVSGQSQIQTLSGFMIAGSDPGHYGQLQMFVTPRDNPVNGPAIVAAQIDATADGLQADHPAQPERVLGAAGERADDPGGRLAALHPAALRGVVAERLPRAATGHRRLREAGGQIASTLSAALTTVFRPRSPPRPSDSGGTGDAVAPGPGAARRGPAGLQQSQADLKAGNLGAYQTTSQTLESDLQEVQQLTGGTVARDHAPPRPRPTPWLDGRRPLAGPCRLRCS